MNSPSDFLHHYRSTSPERAEVLMVVLVTIASVVVCGWIAVWPPSNGDQTIKEPGSSVVEPDF